MLGFAHDGIQEVGVDHWIATLRAADLAASSYDDGTNETMTADLLADLMQRAQLDDGRAVFSNAEVERAISAIRNTTVAEADHDAGSITQLARDSDDAMSFVLADGDLAGSCGSVRSTHRSLLLLLEEKAKAGDFAEQPTDVRQISQLPLSQEEVVRYLGRQRSFCGNYRFILPSTEDALAEQRQVNLEILQAYGRLAERAEAADIPALYANFVDLSRTYARTGQVPRELADQMEPAPLIIDLGALGLTEAEPSAVHLPRPAPEDGRAQDDLDTAESGARPERSYEPGIEDLPSSAADFTRGSGPVDGPVDEPCGWEPGPRGGAIGELEL